MRYRLNKKLIEFGGSSASDSPSNSVTKRSSENGIEKFGWDTSWSLAYFDMLDEEGELGRHIRWQQVEKHTTQTIMQLNMGGTARGMTPRQLWGDVTSDENETNLEEENY